MAVRLLAYGERDIVFVVGVRNVGVRVLLCGDRARLKIRVVVIRFDLRITVLAHKVPVTISSVHTEFELDRDQTWPNWGLDPDVGPKE